MPSSGGCSGPCWGCGRGQGALGALGALGAGRAPRYLPGAPLGDEHSAGTFGCVVSAGAACVPWCLGAARCPQSPSWLQRAPATSALAGTLGVTWVTVLRAPGGPGVAAGGSPRLHKDITNRPHDSFITPWGQSVWEMGRPLTPADGGLNHRRLRLDFTTADPQQSPFQAVWGWACFALPELQEQFQQFGPKEAASM